MLFSKFLAFVCVLLALVAAAQAGSCKNANAPVGKCTVDLKVCGKLSKLKWKYSADAWESETRLHGSAGGYKSGQGAAEGAITNMFNNHPQLQVKCFASLDQINWDEIPATQE